MSMTVLAIIMSPHRGQKRASGPLELELQMIVSCCVGAGNQELLTSEPPPNP